MEPDAPSSDSWPTVVFDRSDVGPVHVPVPRGTAVWDPPQVLCHGTVGGVAWLLQYVEIGPVDDAVARLEINGPQLEFLAFVDRTWDGGNAKTCVPASGATGTGYRYGAAPDMVVWVIAIAAEISTAQVTLEDGRARRVAALDVTVPSGASVVLFAIPAEHEALLTLRDRGDRPWGAPQRLPSVQRPQSAWHASSFRSMDPALRERPRVRRQDDELMPDSEWFASQLREESTWTYELQDMPFAVHVLAPMDWCVRVGWGLGLGTEELSVVYLDDAWFERSGRGGRRVELISSNRAAVATQFPGSSSEMWWTSTATPGQSVKEFWTSLGDAFVEDFDAGKKVRFVGTRSVDVGGRRRPLQQWQPPTGAWSVLFRVDMPDAWLTAIATGVSADEVERWLHDVEPLRPGTATFRALRALS